MMALAAPAQVEPKMQVNQFCQKKVGRPITKTDITYTTQKHGNAYQSTIQLTCLGGVAFVGELVGNAKTAESAAAAQVLKHYAAEIAALAAQPKDKTGTKRPLAAIGGVGISGPADKVQKVDGEQTPSGPTPPKKEINEICMKLAKRALTKNEIVYNSRAVAGGFQSTLQLTCLPGVYGENLFTGTVCPNKKEAEVSVATIAVETLKADAELAEVLNKPKDIKKGKGKGKGKLVDPYLYKTKMCTNFAEGTCKRGENCTFAHDASELVSHHDPALAKTKMCMDFEAGTCPRGEACSFAHDASELKERPPPPPGKGKGKGKFNPMMGMDPSMMEMNPMMQMMQFMQMMSGGVTQLPALQDKKDAGPKKGPGKRERVSSAKVSGTVEVWKGHFGWIKPSQPFEHENAKKHSGKIYLAKQDVPAGVEVKAGSTLTFHVYADNDGIGAEDVSI